MATSTVETYENGELVHTGQAEVPAEHTNQATLQADAAQALAGLRNYRDNASPTNPQTVTAVKLLCRVAIGLIRLQLHQLDNTG